jgi:transposase
MQIVYERCAVLDVHKKSLVDCLLVQESNGPTRKERQIFSTMTADLLRLRDWLMAQGCTHVAMESTGVFWNPSFNVCEGHLEVLVVNA